MNTLESYKRHIITAREFLNIAGEQQDVDPVAASKNYLMAAKEFNEALLECKDPDIAVMIENKVDYCRTQADRYMSRKDDNILKIGGEEGLKRDFSSEIPKITYEDVAGMHELKQKLIDKIMLPIRYNDIYHEFVKKKNQGIILYGPPGCGKTYITEATVGELNKRLKEGVSYISVQISDILSQYVGVSEKNLDNAFKEAAEQAPAILFFDEIDALGGSRSGSNTQSYDRKLVNQFLSSFNRIEDKLVLVIGATNYPWGVDSALLRSGRFGRAIRVDPPDYEAKKTLFQLELSSRRISDNINIEKLAELTEDMTYSDIVQICDEAGEMAIRDLEQDDNRKITYKDLLIAIKNQQSSLYKWCEQAEGPLERGEIPPSFSDIIELFENANRRRLKKIGYTQNMRPKHIAPYNEATTEG